MSDNPIIVALDVATPSEAMTLVRRLGDSVAMYKVGLELFTAAGPAFVEELRAEGRGIFLDLKFYDIPETVKRATARVVGMGVDLLTIHASYSVMRGAVEGRNSLAGSGLRLVGVTVLTSFDEHDLQDLGSGKTVAELVEQRARKASEAGMDGIVCSPLEAAAMRTLLGPDKLLIVPGIRSAGMDAGDQKRIATPREAVAAGASYLVIGRQITRAADPRAAALGILEEIG
jgi:orotidine-5'-phosphate decarboxylase